MVLHGVYLACIALLLLVIMILLVILWRMRRRPGEQYKHLLCKVLSTLSICVNKQLKRRTSILGKYVTHKPCVVEIAKNLSVVYIFSGL